ncbi:hypothetical protein [Pseudogracilibacillus auburnensis]|uniref:hypothetical protein n=1 Tax=Pseudogracilibacillus auburnensis TaxID=1494959 RepID=UPI001A96A41A|nr:hypothetical protein [Pseudogracilibacillus auburnensis]MBO1002664.1 hypothetical protein [Pseudogracilibacillus auburnensis]
MYSNINGEVKTITISNKDVTSAGIDLYISDKPFVIESFHYGTTSKGSLNPRLWSYGNRNGSGFSNLFTLAKGGSGGRTTATSNAIALYGSPYFEISSFDDSSSNYSFFLKRPIYMPTGGRLSIQGLTSYVGGESVSYHVVIRESQ